MTTASRCAHDRRVSEPSSPIHLVLELDPAVEPVRGTVRDEAGHTRTYVGWLALIGALDELRGVRTKESRCEG
jgi:hypothetical protein